MDISDIKFVDSVIRIPENSIRITLSVETIENGKTYTVKGELNPSDVREAINLFSATLEGDYPVYVLTEEGEEYVDKHL